MARSRARAELRAPRRLTLRQETRPVSHDKILVDPLKAYDQIAKWERVWAEAVALPLGYLVVRFQRVDEDLVVAHGTSLLAQGQTSRRTKLRARTRSGHLTVSSCRLQASATRSRASRARPRSSSSSPSARHARSSAGRSECLRAVSTASRRDASAAVSWSVASVARVAPVAPVAPPSRRRCASSQAPFSRCRSAT